MAFLEATSDAVVLPAIAKAFLSVDGKPYTLAADDPEPEAYRFEQYSNATTSELLGRPLPDGTDVESIRDNLLLERNRSDFLFFLLASLDQSLSYDVREEAGLFVEALLGDDQMYEYAEDLLLSEAFRPTPDAPLELAFPELHNYARLIANAIVHQSAIEFFWRGWRALVEETDPLALSFDLDSLRDLLLRSGFVSRFIRSIYFADLRAFNKDLVDFALRPEVRSRFSSASQLLNHLKNFLDRHHAFEKLQLKLAVGPGQELEQDPLRGGRYPRPLGGYEVYSQVTKQIESIKGLLLTGSQVLVAKAVSELLTFQEHHSEKEYIAKTLCNLAKAAIDANEIHTAKQLADEAVSLGVDDVVVDGTAAEVMKNLGHFSEAKRRYEAALLKYGGERYLINGLADVLKESGDFQKALSIYGEAAVAFPDDPVAPNGSVTVYFAMGHFQTALVKAEKNVATFGDAVSRIIYGNILRHLGRNHESLALMQESIRHFPNELGIWNGYIRSLALVGRHAEALAKCDELKVKSPQLPLARMLYGELLRRIGRLQESLESYDRSIELFPQHRGLQIGRAAVLVLLGRAEEVPNVLGTSELQSELDWRSFHIFALSLIRTRDYTKALESLEWGLANVPWLRLRALFSDTIGYVRLRMGQIPSAIERFREGLKTADKAKRNGLYLLLSNAYSEIGNVGESSRYLREVNSADPLTMQLKRAIRPGMQIIRNSEPEAQEIEQNEIQILLAAA